ncbi:MAG: hypothetical protein ABJM11_16445 [Marinobacter sp.]|uniref:hypothetical protein n=1 Tax=Marinobacter sp. TaxID=50741 RepID=UPI003299AC6A
MLENSYAIYSDNPYLREMAERILKNKLNQTIFSVEFTGPVIELYAENDNPKKRSHIFIRSDANVKLTDLIKLNCKIIRLSDESLPQQSIIKNSAHLNITGINNYRLCTYALSLAIRIIESNQEIKKALNLILLPNAGDGTNEQINK